MQYYKELKLNSKLINLRQIIGRLYGRLFRKKFDQYPVCVNPRGKISGTVLFSYLPGPLLWFADSNKFSGHTNKWESRHIALTFVKLGYRVEAINWDDLNYIPPKNYDIVFDIAYNLGRLEPYYSDNTIKLLHCTGSDPQFQNQAESERVAELNLRKNGHYSPKRLIPNLELNYSSLNISDQISLLGNKNTLATYKEDYQKKISLIPVSASKTKIKSKSEFIPNKKEFLWFFGDGAVHKGLDLVLDAFSRHPGLVLHVVGNAGKEEDFLDIYSRELSDFPNIHNHGYMSPGSIEFYSLLDNIFSFIAPSCSEGISPAVVTCLQIGLFPILSVNTGVTLPENCGIYLDCLSVEQVEAAIVKAYDIESDLLMKQIGECQKYALDNFSRDVFSLKIREYIETAINLHQQKII